MSSINRRGGCTAGFSEEESRIGKEMQEHCGRRNFMKGAGTVLIGAVAGAGLGCVSGRAERWTVSQTEKTQQATSPREAVEMLKAGNARFVQGNMLNRDLMQQVTATADGQFPIAAIVGCIDSRASNELIFDQGIGDIFSARVAGNFVNDDILGSLEFACKVAGARLVLVLGHTDCGAVKGACDDVVLGNLTQTLSNIKPAVAAVSGYDSDRSSKNSAFVQAVAEKNVGLTLQQIRKRSPILRELIDQGQVGLEGAMYDVRTGEVRFL